ncbi:MAG: hypothetical protein IJ250_05470 [Bacteroidales bacterium]|nr:hypothetical protein [Bacteroidales bacterium]
MKRVKTMMWAAVAVFLTASMTANAQNEVKKHEFGVGLSSDLTCSTNPFLKAGSVLEGFYGKVDKNLDLNFSFVYQYNINSHFNLGTGLI